MLFKTILQQPTQDVVVVIPIYKTNLNAYETASLDACIGTLGSHPVIAISPAGLPTADIQGIAANNIKTEYFPQEYFNSSDDYNRLMMSPLFYKRFSDFRYILIYQLDAFVFADQLSFWCGMNYDYIGAPWLDAAWFKFPEWVKYFKKIKNRTLLTGDKKLRVVGNGGFSLRKTRSFLLALTLLQGKAAKWQKNEDVFWSFEVPRYLPFFKIPSNDLALKFAFETNPAKCFELNNQELPFGCHAWEKHDIEFWRPVFRDHGYQI